LYGKAPHRRQRWLCRPPNGDRPHRFTPVLTRQGEPHPFCEECSTALEPWEGQAGAREYRFAAREVGEALVAVACGGSYKSAAEAARRAADRLPAAAASRRHWRQRDPARDGQLVANWVDVFSDLVCAGELPTRWPATLLIDSRGFRITSGQRAGRGFYVFAAIGIETDDQGRQQRGRLWRLEAFARKDQAAWEAFFGALEGVPEVIVSDADKALACAIDTAFAAAAPEHRLCEWHLGRKLRDHLPDSLLADHAHPVTRALPAAFHSPEKWQQLTHAIALEQADRSHGPLALTLKWLATYGQRIEAQIATRDPRGPHSTRRRRAAPPRDRPALARPRGIVHQPRPDGQAARPHDARTQRQGRRAALGRPAPRAPLPRRRTPHQPAPPRRPQRQLLPHRLTGPPPDPNPNSHIHPNRLGTYVRVRVETM